MTHPPPQPNPSFPHSPTHHSIPHPIETLVLAALWERRKFTTHQLLRRLSSHGIKISPAELEIILDQINHKFQSDPSLPFSLFKAAGKFWLKGKSLLIEQISSNGKIKTAEQLEPRTLEVLAVIIFHPGITRSHIHELLRFDPEPHLAKLQTQNLILSIPGPGRSQFWHPTPEVLVRFGYQSWREIPHYAEFNAHLQSFKKNTTQNSRPSQQPNQSSNSN
ncbi:MAG: SMC-Scp complex subunit ScpB [Chthoniobacterales bacterium]|nr:SMC-Scp complex subunit ScpB [Chthoniobacterales bacterium]